MGARLEFCSKIDLSFLSLSASSSWRVRVGNNPLIIPHVDFFVWAMACGSMTLLPLHLGTWTKVRQITPNPPKLRWIAGILQVACLCVTAYMCRCCMHTMKLNTGYRLLGSYFFARLLVFQSDLLPPQVVDGWQTWNWSHLCAYVSCDPQGESGDAKRCP